MGYNVKMVVEAADTEYRILRRRVSYVSDHFKLK